MTQLPTKRQIERVRVALEEHDIAMNQYDAYRLMRKLKNEIMKTGGSIQRTDSIKLIRRVMARLRGW